jgi:uncharacterized protein involved in exopolysaccharide biosynthesis
MSSSTPEQRTSRFPLRRRLGRTPWILVPTMAGVLIGYVIAARATPIYRSDALFLVVAQRVPENVVQSTVTAKFSERLQSISQRILSRTRLEQIIQDFNLYQPERRSGQHMEDIVDGMRKNIDIQMQAGERENAFRIGFIGTDPRTVMKVTERLASLFIDEKLKDREVLAESTNQFLEAQIEGVSLHLRDLNETLRVATKTGKPEAETLAIEYDALKSSFKDLITKREQSRMARNLERLQIGEQFKLLDPARIPERPISPDYREYVGVGALSGLGLGVLLLFSGPSSPLKKRRAKQAEVLAPAAL